jgi:phosphoglycolate phosphatase
MSATYFEEDYRPVAADSGGGSFLPGTSIEIIRELGARQPLRHVLFDFDGTLSLIREGWVEVMVPLMVEILAATGADESPQALESLVREFVSELTGKQTIYQMIRLAEEVQKRGGKPREPADYKQMYHDRLMERIADRREALRSGRASPDDMLVPGSRPLLDELRRQGAALYVASGTDEPYVIEEVRLLGLADDFGPHVYGARDDYRAFSKAMVIDRILKENRVPGAQLLGFGDGYVEIQNIKSVGGVAVAVASDEAQRSGKPDAWKRERLIGAGADVVIPDYREHRALLGYLSVGRTNDAN